MKDKFNRPLTFVGVARPADRSDGVLVRRASVLRPFFYVIIFPVVIAFQPYLPVSFSSMTLIGDEAEQV